MYFRLIFCILSIKGENEKTMFVIFIYYSLNSMIKNHVSEKIVLLRKVRNELTLDVK